MYALITGYVYINSKHKYSKIISLWIKVFFYSFFITLIYHILFPDTAGPITLTRSAFPVITKQYWYFTAYFGLFMFMPFLNILIKNLSKKQHQILIISIVFCFCILNFIGRKISVDVFNIGNGYSMLWLAGLYVIGAYLKLYSNDFEKYNNKIFLLLYLSTIFLTFILRLASKLIKQKITGDFPIGEGLFVSYISPLILLGAIGLVIYFSRLEIKDFKNAILKLFSLSFGVYLFSEQPVIRNNFITSQFAVYAHSHPIIMFSNIIIRSMAIYLICSGVEYLREKLFRALKINKLITTAEKIFYKGEI